MVVKGVDRFFENKDVNMIQQINKMKNKILLFAFKCNTPIYYMITFRYFVL